MPSWNTEGSQSRFLREAEFKGKQIKAGGPVKEGGQSTYNGLMTFPNVPRNLVTKLLPPNFELAVRATNHDPDVHPVVLLFGDQTDCAWVGRQRNNSHR